LTSQSDQPYLRILFAACAVILAAAAILYLAFQDRALSFDEAGLQNPPYMLLHYARMTYPIHGHFDDMVVHPPTHYAAIALFQWLGLSLFHAAAAEDVLFFVLAALLLVTARVPYAGKFGLMFGTYLAVVIWTSTQTMRPDVTLALAWIAGLIGLESARWNEWDPKRLFIGSALLAYAAALHYTGSFCWLGILVYMAWVWRSLERRAALRRIAMMAGGLALVGIPYLLMFLVPYHRQILEMVSQTQGEGGFGTALQHHVDAYRQWANLRRPICLAAAGANAADAAVVVANPGGVHRAGRARGVSRHTWAGTGSVAASLVYGSRSAPQRWAILRLFRPGDDHLPRGGDRGAACRLVFSE
jgi:hypothetical protein